MLHHHIVPAGAGQGAQERLHAGEGEEERLEQTDGCRRQPVFEIADPQVEERAQKSAVILRARGERGRGSPAAADRFHARGELHVRKPQIFERAVDLLGKPHRVVVDHGKGVHLHTAVQEQLCPVGNPGPGAASIAVSAVAVVDMGRPVDGQSHEKPVFPEKGSPLFVEQEAVGLKGVAHRQPASIALLEVDRMLKELQPHQCRLASLPGEYRLGAGLAQELPNHLRQHLPAHPVLRGIAEQVLLSGIEAVCAGHVAIRAGRLDENAGELSLLHAGNGGGKRPQWKIALYPSW